METLATAFAKLALATKIAKEASDAVKNISDVKLQNERQKIELAAKKINESVLTVEAQLAQTFDYQLCKCTFPPQVCKLIGHDEKTLVEISQCPNCMRKYPPVFGA